MSFVCTPEGFANDIVQHGLTVLHESGLYRHLRCKKPDSYDQGFDIITYPGQLVYTGDMGTYVFERLPDMLEFFRDGGEAGSALKINPGYWDEKVEAACVRDGVHEYDPQIFRSIVEDRLKQYIDDSDDLDEDQKEELRADVEDQLLDKAQEDEAVVRDAISEFQSYHSHGELLTDLQEHSLSRHTGRFIWCCYAIVWAIRQYDAFKAKQPAAA